MGRIHSHPLVLGGWRTEQPSPECFLLLVQVPNLEFCKIFKSSSGFRMVLSNHSRCMILTWGRSFRPSFPYFYNWYVEFVGRESVAYLGYLYCRAEWWSEKDWNLTKFRSYGIARDGGRWTHAWEGNLVFYLNSLFATLWESGIFFSHFQLFFLENNLLFLLLKWF